VPVKHPVSSQEGNEQGGADAFVPIAEGMVLDNKIEQIGSFFSMAVRGFAMPPRQNLFQSCSIFALKPGYFVT